MNVGIIGCGAISGIYIQNCYRLSNLRLVGLAGRDVSKAVAKREEIKAKYHGEWGLRGEVELPVACSIPELLANREVDAVLNLTVPKAHAELALAALEAGKHTYLEKPLALNRADGKKVLEEAKARGLRVGCAPDTFLGGGLQTCRKLIDDGWIGKPIGCVAFMTCPGHEGWHPDPEFYYEEGGGPVFDMAPYYLTALVNMLGPVKRVSGAARATYATRMITSAKKYGKVIPVETPTHVSTTLEFASGAIGTMVMSFDVFGAHLPHIEVFGSGGSLKVPDPNTFGGEVEVKVGRGEWGKVPLVHGYRENSRGLGLADMAAGIEKGRPHRASGELAYHVLDVMQATLEAAREGRAVEIGSTADRPAAMAVGGRDWEVE